MFRENILRLFGPADDKKENNPSVAERPSTDNPPKIIIPILHSYRAKITAEIETDLANNIRSVGVFKDLDSKSFERLRLVAVEAISRGGDLGRLCSFLLSMNIDDLDRKRAGEICHLLHRKANSLLERDKQLAAGITHAAWMYSNAPCQMSAKKPSPRDIRQDKAHKAVDGMKYEIAKGLVLNGRRTWPGREEGCRCCSRAFLPGLT